MANPPTPARLIVPVEKTISGYSGTDNVRFFVVNVQNPSTQGMNVGVEMSIYQSDSDCGANTRNEHCAIFKAKGYYVTTSATENLQTTSSTFTPSSTTLLANSLNHQFQFTATDTINTDDVIIIVYPENYVGEMPSTCSVSNFYCYVFPTRRWVVLYPSTTIISGSGSVTLSLNSYMHNGYYSQPYTENFLVTVARGSGASVNADTYEILHSPFVTVKKSLSSNVASTLSISATQTPNIFLRNYANTAIFTIDNIFIDERIKSLYIKAPTDVTGWDADYCNASITSTGVKTYPLRFTCRVFTENTTNPVLQIIPEDQDMSPYNTVWDDYNIKVHAKFTL